MKIPAALVRQVTALSTLRYCPRLSTLLYAVAVELMLATAAFARFRLPQVLLIDGDWWGYFNPVFSALSGRGFQHTYGRDSLYPAFLLAIFKLGGGFRAVCVVQHLLGLVTGLVMLAAWWRGCRLLRGGDEKMGDVLPFAGFLPVWAYLSAPTSIRFEHCLRPEAVFPLFIVLSIWLNLEFIFRRWVVPAPRSAAWLGAVQLVVSLIAYKLKPAFGFGLIFANLPMAASLLAKGMPLGSKILMASGGGVFCLLALLLPESLLKKTDPIAFLFLPDTLMTVHADQIRDQMAEDRASNRQSPFPPDQVSRLFARLEETLARARLPEYRPYPTLGFNPDYLLYTDCVYEGVTRHAPGGYIRRAALGYYYYRETFLYHPSRMLAKIQRQMNVFYTFKHVDRAPIFSKRMHLRGTKIDIGIRDYGRNVDILALAQNETGFGQFPTMPDFVESSRALSRTEVIIEQKPIPTAIRKLLELLYMPALLMVVPIAGWTLWTRRSKPRSLLPIAVTLLLFSYNFGNNLTISIVHSLDIGRYIEGQLAFTLLASAFGILLAYETLRSLVAGSLAATPADSPPR